MMNNKVMAWFGLLCCFATHGVFAEDGVTQDDVTHDEVTQLDLATDADCTKYTYVAVAQTRAAQELSCRYREYFDYPKWDDHYSWCRSHTLTRILRIERLRTQALWDECPTFRR